MAVSAVGRRRDAVQEPASSRLQVPEHVLYNRQQVLESQEESLDSDDGEYERNDGESEESEESEENELGQHGDDMDHPAAWGAQRPIGRKFLSSLRSILTITPGNTQNSSTRMRYPGWRTSAQVCVSQNGCTSGIPSRSPTDFNPPAMPVITQVIQIQPCRNWIAEDSKPPVGEIWQPGLSFQFRPDLVT